MGIIEEYDSGKTRTQIDKEKKKERISRENAKQQKLRFKQLEKDIQTKEDRLVEIEEIMGRAETWQNHEEARNLEKERQDIQEELENMYSEWEELAEAMEE